jgi:hypothetical protein
VLTIWDKLHVKCLLIDESVFFVSWCNKWTCIILWPKQDKIWYAMCNVYLYYWYHIKIYWVDFFGLFQYTFVFFLTIHYWSGWGSSNAIFLSTQFESQMELLAIPTCFMVSLILLSSLFASCCVAHHIRIPFSVFNIGVHASRDGHMGRNM